MRTLKFRVWNHKTKDWVEGHGRNDISSLDGVNLFGETILLGAFMNGVSIVDLNDCVAVQYTGFNDKNDKQIFEGDVLMVDGSYEDLVEGDGNAIGSVIFKNGSFYIHDNSKNTHDELLAEFIIGKRPENLDLTVIGNIFENPDLK
jgi:uncharacterized phage protein (TIGR01671 family)